jgi:hypothetical protein
MRSVSIHETKLFIIGSLRVDFKNMGVLSCSYTGWKHRRFSEVHSHLPFRHHETGLLSVSIGENAAFPVEKAALLFLFVSSSRSRK